jgi:hypothetical protein
MMMHDRLSVKRGGVCSLNMLCLCVYWGFEFLMGDIFSLIFLCLLLVWQLNYVMIFQYCVKNHLRGWFC